MEGEDNTTEKLPIICVPGFMCEARPTFENTVMRIEDVKNKERTVFYLDPVGVGNNINYLEENNIPETQGAQHYSLEGQALYLMRFIKDLQKNFYSEDQKFIILGHSFGGIVTLLANEKYMYSQTSCPFGGVFLLDPTRDIDIAEDKWWNKER